MRKSKALNLRDCDIIYFSNFLDSKKASSYFEIFKNTVPWQQDTIKVFGKVYAQPRLTALFGNNGKPYSYSNIIMQPHQFTEELLQIKQQIETLPLWRAEKTKVAFTTCLLNLYRAC